MSIATARATALHAPAVPAALTLDAVFATLVRNIVTVLMGAIFAATLALGYFAFATPRYMANTEVLLDPRGLQVIERDLTPQSSGSDLAIALAESQVRVIQSEAVLRGVIERLHLDRDPEFLGTTSMIARLKSLFVRATATEPAQMTALRTLQDRISAKRADRSFVISINAISEDALKAARIADTMAAVYLERETATRAETARRTGGALNSRLKELADAVQRAETRVQQYKAQNNLVGTRDQLVSDQQLSELNNRLVAARTRVTEERSRFQQIERLVKSGAEPDTIAEAVQSQVIASLRTAYADIIRQESTIGALLGARHPDAIAVREQRQRYRTLITQELRRVADAAANDYARAQATEVALTAELDALKRTAVATGEASVRLRELDREVDASRAIYQSFLNRAKEIGEQTGLDNSSTRVIAVAIAPDRPVGPSRLVILLGAIFAGLAIGGALVILSQGALPRRAA